MQFSISVQFSVLHRPNPMYSENRFPRSDVNHRTGMLVRVLFYVYLFAMLNGAQAFKCSAPRFVWRTHMCIFKYFYKAIWCIHIGVNVA